MDLSLGWQTDLAVLRLGRSVVEDRGDHLVVRTPENPTYHWGNFVLVTDPATVDDAARWLATFEEAFPETAHRAIGLPVEPSADGPWTILDLELERGDVLISTEPLRATALADGYEVRALRTSTDWAASTTLRETAYPGHGDFERLSTETRWAMAERGEVTWFGAGDRLVPAVADTIRRLAREADFVARVGDGRFAVLLPETDEIQAINYVERVRRTCDLWLESGAVALKLVIGWASASGDDSLLDAGRIATERMYAEIHRNTRRSADLVPDEPVEGPNAGEAREA